MRVQSLLLFVFYCLCRFFIARSRRTLVARPGREYIERVCTRHCRLFGRSALGTAHSHSREMEPISSNNKQHHCRCALAGFPRASFQISGCDVHNGFCFLLLIDRRLFQNDLITRQYFQTRCIVTAIVILTLLVSGIVS